LNWFCQDYKRVSIKQKYAPIHIEKSWPLQHTGEAESQVEKRHYEDRISLQVSDLKSITTGKLVPLILSAETGSRVCNLTLSKKHEMDLQWQWIREQVARNQV